MTIRTTVYSSTDHKNKEINIDTNKPSIDDATILKWQNIINIISSIYNFSSTTILKINEDGFDILLASKNDSNSIKDTCKECNSLLYEEIIARNSELIISNIIDNSLFDEICSYKNSMTSFYGLPIKWPDEEFFGTIYVMDDKENEFDPTFKALIEEFTSAIEADLRLILQSEQLEQLVSKDPLTGIFNRKRINQLFTNEFSRARRFEEHFSILLIDIDKFKVINDNFGYQTGDTVLKLFVDLILSRIRVIDMLGRWGSDEFLLVCPNTNFDGALKLKEDIVSAVENHNISNIPDLSCSIGIAEYTIDDETAQEYFARAEVELLKEKSTRRR